MPSPALEQLLILQERDRRRRDTEGQLLSTPREVAAVEAKIAAERGAIEAAKTEIKDLEAKKKVLETEIGSAEQQVSRYRSQQLEVRKNDEYRALGHEIETTQAKIGQFEEQELGIMYAIDEARKKFQAAEAVLRENIVSHETRIRALRERELRLKSELGSVLADVEAAKKPIDQSTLDIYERVARHNFPVCVPVHGDKCGGCHLKVSSEVESAVRAREWRLITCDQCGRIVWWELV
jgi:predicted  nucleic acid-binding Zn-ribbon protein